jgi:hypothetical protein
MLRSPAFRLGLAGLLLAGWLTALATHVHLEHSPVYTVAQVQTLLAREPKQWLGRTLLLHGMVAGEPAYHPMPSLVDADAAVAIAPLPVARSTRPDPLRAFLRRVPLLGELVPAPQALRWGADATYRVQLRGAPGTWCTMPPCYQAVLLDAAPAASWSG